ncbi:flagellin [Peptostreptococcaceae bacterium AGR-M142]
MAIGGIGYNNSLNMMKLYSQLTSGKRINSASDDAAGLAIANKMEALETGYDKGTSNIESMVDLADTAEGALSSINDSLQRMRELSLQASNGILAAEDKVAIQTEIDSLKNQIRDVAKNTEFNTMKLIDGSFTDKNVATGPSAQGTKMTIEDASLEALGIKDFDVTGNFDISQIDDAISKVTEARTNIGAKTNALESNIRSNQVALENQVASRSRIEDLDIARAITQLNTNNVLSQYEIFGQKMQMNQFQNSMNILL